MKPTLEKAMQLLQRWVDETAGKNPRIPYKLTTDTLHFLRIMKECCPGHAASDDDPKVCRYCGTHIDEFRS